MLEAAEEASGWYKNLPFIVGYFSTWWSTEWLKHTQYKYTLQHKRTSVTTQNKKNHFNRHFSRLLSKPSLPCYQPLSRWVGQFLSFLLPSVPKQNYFGDKGFLRGQISFLPVTQPTVSKLWREHKAPTPIRDLDSSFLYPWPDFLMEGGFPTPVEATDRKKHTILLL